MMKQAKYIRAIFILAAVLLGVNSMAQSPMSIYYLETLPQINNTNPAMTPRSNTYVSLPSVYAAAHSDLSAEDLLQKHNGKWVTPIDKHFKYDDLYKSVGKSTSISAEASIAPIGFGFRTNKGYVTFSLSQKVSARSNWASDILKITEKGLPANTKLDLSRTGQKMIAYKEISLGYAHHIDEKLTVGIHVKPLFGQVATISKIDNFEIRTGLYEYTLQVEGDVYSSAPLDIVEGEDGFPDKVEGRDLSSSDFNSKYLTGFKNAGLAFDLGGVYDYDEKFTFSAALNNLGFIRWRNDLHSLSVKGEYKFEGTDVTLITIDSISDILENELDSIRDVLDGDTGTKKFSTALAPSLYLGGQYKINHAVSLGLLLRSTFEKHNFRQAFNISANYNPLHFLTASINFNTEINGSSALGLGLAFRGGPFQFYMIADHIPLKYYKIENEGSSYPAPLHLESVSFMTGINFIIGAKGNKEKQKAYASK